MSDTITARAGALYARASGIADGLQAPLLLAIRLYWGWQFFLAGKGKLLNLERTTQFFASLGIPAPGINAVAAGATECAGGLLLAAGLGARLAAVPLVVTMVVAYLTAHLDAVKGVLRDPDAFVTQAPFLFLLASLVVLAFGPGALSGDALVARLTARPSKDKQPG